MHSHPAGATWVLSATSANLERKHLLLAKSAGLSCVVTRLRWRNYSAGWPCHVSTAVPLSTGFRQRIGIP
ncbi:hypothetical protein T01_2641 [Trichinella spiralis]|uniref:Uncharacterized protein n=1 Tax=Trichinella spiralis TaxID=6334 RepID=A0A0V1AV02_TRISP|nr:hypothetical protein T01_2641 [Trichinella spiralis]